MPEDERDGDLVAAYARLMEHPDSAVRERAAQRLVRVGGRRALARSRQGRRPYGDRPDDARLAFVRICAHYFSHAAWLEEGALIRDARRLAGIPGC